MLEDVIFLGDAKVAFATSTDVWAGLREKAPFDVKRLLRGFQLPNVL